MPSSERIRATLFGWLSRARRMRRRMLLIRRSFRTAAGRERLRLGVYQRFPWIVKQLAVAYRATFIRRVHVIAIVGSFGKTTTTRAIQCALGLNESRHRGWNAGVGPAAALLRIRPRFSSAAIEVGIADKGQMGSFARLLKPDIAVVTNIGSEHHRSLQTLECTRREKAKMAVSVPSSGVVVLNGDDDNALWMGNLCQAPVITYGLLPTNDVYAIDVEDQDLNGVRFTLSIGSYTRPVSTRLIGSHMVYPILAAVAVARQENRDMDEIVAAIEQLSPTWNRLYPIALDRGVWLLLDAFKGALETIDVALAATSKLTAKRRIVVLGDVEEPPGSQGAIYRALGNQVAEVADHVVFVGGKTNFNRLKAGTTQGGLSREALHQVRTDPPAIVRTLDEIGLQSGDLVLIKGRSTQHLERVALLLMGRAVACCARACIRRHDCSSCPQLADPA